MMMFSVLEVIPKCGAMVIGLPTQFYVVNQVPADRFVVVVEGEERGDGGDLEELRLPVGEERVLAHVLAPLPPLLQVVPGEVKVSSNHVH